MKSKIWKTIDELNHTYEVSYCGSIRKVGSEQELTQRQNSNGYLTVGLSQNSRRHSRLVHRLIASAFVDNPMRKEFVNHIDFDKQNNAVSNLEWVTRSENNKHARDSYRGYFKPVVAYMGEEMYIFKSMKDGAEFVGRSTSSIWSSMSANCRGKTCGGYYWRYI